MSEDIAEIEQGGRTESTLNKNRRMLLRRVDVAHLLQVSERTVQNLQGDGLKAIKIGRCVRFKHEDVLEFINGLEYQ